MVLSDVDATNFELEQEALTKSWDSYGRHEHGGKQRASPSSPAGRRRPRSFQAAAASTYTASLPAFSESASSVAAIPPPASAAAASSSAAAASASFHNDSYDEMNTEYSQNVQELVMNGFELKKVIQAYELVGDNFDDLLSYLISTVGNGP